MLNFEQKGKGISYFNPRSREGSDARLFGIERITVNISIHAPVKGATLIEHLCSGRCIFQSTLP